MFACKLHQHIVKQSKRISLLQIFSCSQSKSHVSRESKEDYTPIYRLPYIKILALINKAKVYQSIAVCIALPLTYALSAVDVCSAEISMGITAIGVGNTTLLYGLGYLTSNTVGIIYLNQEKEKLKISYLDAWGARKDVEIEMENITPFSDQPAAITDSLYLKICQYTNKDTYKLHMKYGVVLNPTKFKSVFLKL